MLTLTTLALTLMPSSLPIASHRPCPMMRPPKLLDSSAHVEVAMHGGGGDDHGGIGGFGGGDDHDDEEWDGTDPRVAAVAVGLVYYFGVRGKGQNEVQHNGDSIFQRIRKSRAEQSS